MVGRDVEARLEQDIERGMLDTPQQGRAYFQTHPNAKEHTLIVIADPYNLCGTGDVDRERHKGLVFPVFSVA